jgi:hypothetical protein
VRDLAERYEGAAIEGGSGLGSGWEREKSWQSMNGARVAERRGGTEDGGVRASMKGNSIFHSRRVSPFHTSTTS